MKNRQPAHVLLRMAAILLAALMAIGTLSGCAGEPGPQGEQGEQGPKGEKGDPGEDGVDGLPGTNGINGTNGVDGADGRDAENVEFRTEGAWIQWKHESDTEWTNLYEIAIAPSIGERVTVGLSTVGGVLPENALSAIEATVGTAVYLPTPTYTGHTFLGWFTENGTKAVANPYTLTESTYLYAHWEVGDPHVDIDPFTGIDYLVTGISPYCTISVNNAGCSEDAQMYVDYTFDKEYYKNGDTVTVTASLNEEVWYTNTDYTLSETSTTYTISGQSAYISSVAGLDLSQVKSEADDYVDTHIGGAIADGSGSASLFNMDTCYIDTATPTFKGAYLSTLKTNRLYDEYYDGYRNMITILYQIDWAGADEDIPHSGTIYVAVILPNLVEKTDNTLTWGLDVMGDLGKTYGSNDTSLDACIDAHVINNRDYYNIIEVTITP